MTRAIVISFALLALAACETTKGAGQDIQNAGGAISDAASDVQNSL
jgi:entericidin B